MGGVCEARAHRIQKSLSDLNGTDVYIHGGTIQGVFRVCREIFVGSKRRPSVQQMMAVYVLTSHNKENHWQGQCFISNGSLLRSRLLGTTFHRR
jgi:hypothetical protein